MSDLLENLKQGLPDAQRKFITAQQKLAAVQAEFQAAQQRLTATQAEFQLALQEFQAYQTLVNVENRKRQPNLPANAAPPLPPPSPNMPQTAVIPAHVVHRPNVVTHVVSNGSMSAPPVEENKSEVNKTELVRELLRQHPNGMTPVEIWGHVHSQFGNRVYLYSVLRRLKDKGDAREKRGKYSIVPTVGEVIQ